MFQAVDFFFFQNLFPLLLVTPKICRFLFLEYQFICVTECIHLTVVSIMEEKYRPEELGLLIPRKHLQLIYLFYFRNKFSFLIKVIHRKLFLSPLLKLSYFFQSLPIIFLTHLEQTFCIDHKAGIIKNKELGKSYI